MGITKMGFEGQVFYGTAGTTGATQVTDLADVSITVSGDAGNTTIRGDGLSIPIETEDITVLKFSAEFTFLLRSTDTALEAFRVAAAAGSPLALRLKDYAAGKGFDGDVVLKEQSHSKPLRGEQTIAFTAAPTRQSGRSPSLYV